MHLENENTAILNRMWSCEARGNWGFVVLALLGLEILIEIYGSNEQKIVACLGKWLIDRNSYKYPLSKKFYYPIAPQKDKQQKHTSLQKKNTRWFKPCPNFIPDRWRSLNFTPWVRVTWTHSPSQSTVTLLELPGPGFFRKPKKARVFFFFSKKGGLFSRFPTRAVREGGMGFWEGFLSGSFFWFFLKQIFDPKRLPHLR